MALDLSLVRKDFPILERRVHDDRRLVFLDSAASSQKPQAVVDAMATYYETRHANVHRGVYAIAEEATEAYEGARRKVARFIGAPSDRGVVFTKNVTEAINLVARSWGTANLRAGDAVLLTELEHHSNLVPWMQLRDELGIELRWLRVRPDGHLDLSDLDLLLDGVKLVAVTAMSNVLGTIPPVRTIADAAHAAGALVLADAAQFVPHVPTLVDELGCDFLGFTGHKMLGPTGIGGVWVREDVLDAMPAYMGGGGMILDVREDGWTPAEIPWRFEAGTPPIAEAVGLAAAIDYLQAIGMDEIREHEVKLTAYAMRAITERHGDAVRIFGPPEPSERGGVLSFAVKDVHPHDVSQVLDQHGVCVRPGHHCAKPLMRCLGVPATARASFYLYNDESDVDALNEALDHARSMFGDVL